MKTRPLHFAGAMAVAAIAGVLAGWLLKEALFFRRGDSSPNQNSPAAGAQSGEGSASVARSVSLLDRTRSEKENQETLQALERSARAHRALWLATQAENAAVAEMPRLIRLAAGDSALVSMIGARWAELDPGHMFAVLTREADGEGAFPERSSLLRTLFKEWVKQDPASVIDALSKAWSVPGSDSWRMTVANDIIKKDVALGLPLLKTWSIRHFIPNMKKVQTWAETNPLQAAEAVAAMNSDHAGKEAMTKVGAAWGASDPEAALAFAAGLDGGLRGALAGSVMKAWAGEDLEAAIAFATAREDVILKARLGQSLVAEWAGEDPAAALEWSRNHLKGEARAEAIGGLIQSVARDDVESAASMVGEMDPGGVKNQAVAKLLETWFKSKEPGARDEAVTWLAGLSDEEARGRALDALHWTWMYEDPEGATAFVAGEHGHLAPSSMVRRVAERHVRRNPESALAWADDLPEKQAEVARQSVLETWMNLQPVTAARWVTTMPEGDQRDWAIGRVARSLARHDVEVIRNWYDDLSNDDRVIAHDSLMETPMQDEAREKLLQALAPGD